MLRRACVQRLCCSRRVDKAGPAISGPWNEIPGCRTTSHNARLKRRARLDPAELEQTLRTCGSSHVQSLESGRFEGCNDAHSLPPARRRCSPTTGTGHLLTVMERLFRPCSASVLTRFMRADEGVQASAVLTTLCPHRCSPLFLCKLSERVAVLVRCSLASSPARAHSRFALAPRSIVRRYAGRQLIRLPPRCLCNASPMAATCPQVTRPALLLQAGLESAVSRCSGP